MLLFNINFFIYLSLMSYIRKIYIKQNSFFSSYFALALENNNNGLIRYADYLVI